mmetsp:Transcript_11534/g.18911  ORF Transcript_11534/g.18911 Transcript_11534/m.18911 type:complete len:82 (-) Transcript_11534:2434-2679(-)
MTFVVLDLPISAFAIHAQLKDICCPGPAWLLGPVFFEQLLEVAVLTDLPSEVNPCVKLIRRCGSRELAMRYCELDSACNVS